MQSPARILVAGGETTAREEAALLLGLAGFDDVASEAAFSFDEESLPPDLVVVVGDLVADLCTEASGVPILAEVPILAITDDPAAAVSAGATDVVDSQVAAKLTANDAPAGDRSDTDSADTDSADTDSADTDSADTDSADTDSADTDSDSGSGSGSESDALAPDSQLATLAVIRTRVQRLIEDGRARRMTSRLALQQDALVRIHTLGVRDGDRVGVLREALMIAVEVMGFDRASVIAHLTGSETAYVIAATDDPTLHQFTVMIENYPEIEAAVDTGEPVLIGDVMSDALTAPVASMLAGTDVCAVAVFPVMSQGSPLGVVVFRKSRPGLSHIDDCRMAFAEIFTGHVAYRLRHGQVLESLRDQTQRISRARYEAERRLRTIESLKEHFEATADGVLVVEESGRILFVNRTAEDITGFAREGIVGQDIGVLVPERERDIVRRVVAQVVGGQNLEAFDLGLGTTSGERIWASVTTSTVLGSSGAAVLSFRDVTAQRALESELRKTKEFLEKLVDSTVDAIFAADLRGSVLIFNQGAERMFGYTAQEVIGHIPVWELYAKGVARQIMRMLRSTQYGGVGRLEQTRREILNKQGELVPVNMTASIIYEHGREVATVGIYSDLRERIRIEQRLLRAQEKLQLTEKQVVVAELAGATAHELNQPLQSIMSYAELIERKLPSDDPHHKEIKVILDEAERMAGIVKKIGRITKYETKEYVGATRVIDLERSSPEHAVPAAKEDSTSGRAIPLLPPDRRAVVDFDDEPTNQVEVDDVLAAPLPALEAAIIASLGERQAAGESDSCRPQDRHGSEDEDSEPATGVFDRDLPLKSDPDGAAGSVEPARVGENGRDGGAQGEAQ